MTKKVAISLPDDLYQRLEQLRRRRGDPRSLVIQEALGEYLVRRERREQIEAYIRGYTEMPETEQEMAETEAWQRAAAKALAEEYPWQGASPSHEEDAEG